MNKLKNHIEIIHKNVQHNQKQYDTKRFIKYNQDRHDNPFAIGDWIKVAQYHTKTGNEGSLSNKFTGPYVVQRILSPTNIEILDPQTNKKKKVHIRYVRYYNRRLRNEINILQIPSAEIDFEKLLKTFTTRKYKSRNLQTITRTPYELAEKIATVAKLYLQNNNNILELFAGDGRITQFLPSPLTAIEKEEYLINIAKKQNINATWIQHDLTHFENINQLIKQHQHKYNIIVSNPPWELGFWTILLSQHLLIPDSKSRLIILLPSDFFVSTANKRQLFHKLHIHIEKQYEVGRWNYLQDLPKTNPRIGTDSIFVITTRRCYKSKTTYKTEWLH